MIVYTITTTAFYILGASVLHRQKEIPKGLDMVHSLSIMYTETLGPWAKNIFLIGAFFVLYSTLFSILASFTRIFLDAFGQIGLIDFKNRKHREKSIAIIAWSLPVLWAGLFLLFKAPVFMIIVGGIGISVMLIIVLYGCLYFRYKILSNELKPSKVFDTWLIVCVALIAFVDVYGIVRLF